MNTYTSNDLQSLFGKCEMECAASRILNLAQASQKSLLDLELEEKDFPIAERDDMEHDGFFQLIENGWLECCPGHYKRYRPTISFLHRIRRKIPTA